MPSSVVIALPLTAATGVTHERISLPSSSTEQAPHCARPQPKRGPCRCSSLCRTYRSGVSRLAVTLCTRPFTLIFSLLAILASSIVLAFGQGACALPHVQARRHGRRAGELRVGCFRSSLGQGLQRELNKTSYAFLLTQQTLALGLPVRRGAWAKGCAEVSRRSSGNGHVRVGDRPRELVEAPLLHVGARDV